MKATTVILIVTEISSSHAARWINQLEGAAFRVHVFQMGRPNGINPLLRLGVVHYPGETAAPPGVAVRPFDPAAPRGRCLARVLDETDPALIHSHGLNINWNDLMAPVAEVVRRTPQAERRPWLYSSWGTDLDFWPGMSPANAAEVARTLPLCDFMTCECLRDAHLAGRYGFRGRFLGLFPDYGGVDFDALAAGGILPAPAKRRGIFLKGRDAGPPDGDPVGRAMVAMDAFAMLADRLRGVPIRIAQATPNVRERAAALVRAGLDVTVLERLDYDALLRTMASCAVFMAVTRNDGLPSALVEAMALGLFPIHADLEPIREWVRHGENGLLVAHDDSRDVARAVDWTLANGPAVLAAGRENASLMRQRMDIALTRRAVLDLYRGVAGVRGGGTPPPGFPLAALPGPEALARGDAAFALARRYWLAGAAAEEGVGP